MLNCLIKYPDSFEPKHYGSPWIGFLLQELLTVQSKGKGRGKVEVKAIPACAWRDFNFPEF
jgi:hypothetical protein